MASILSSLLNVVTPAAASYFEGQNARSAEDRRVADQRAREAAALRRALESEGLRREEIAAEGERSRSAQAERQRADLEERAARAAADRDERAARADADRRAAAERAREAAETRKAIAVAGRRGGANDDEPDETPEQVRLRRLAGLRGQRAALLERAVPTPPSFPGPHGGYFTPADSANADQARQAFRNAVASTDSAQTAYERTLRPAPTAAPLRGNAAAFTQGLAALQADRARVEAEWTASGGMPPDVRAQFEQRYNDAVGALGQQHGVQAQVRR